MERLEKISHRLVSKTSLNNKRFLFHEIDWKSERLIGILGGRGTGKTTMFLQYVKERNQESKNTALYVSLDDFYFETNRLIILAEEIYEKGYKILVIDEVHKHKNWSKDVKNIFDSLPDLRICFTGSSILDLLKSDSDLSRRAAMYTLPGLSFREFLSFNYGEVIESTTLQEILQHHASLAPSIGDHIGNIQKKFKDYLKAGYYPFFLESPKTYLPKLLNVTNLVIEVDLPSILQIDYRGVRNIKKLLKIIAESVPFTPDITKLSAKVGISRPTTLKYLDALERASILALLRSRAKLSRLTKPDKIFVDNPNIAWALADSKPNVGNIRETFFYNQLAQKHKVTTPRYGDFMVDGTYVFEVGGASKTNKQIIGVPNAFIAADDIDFGTGNKIPLWLFGMLY